MKPHIIFHRLVQRDMDEILRWYRNEASERVADQFCQAFLDTVEKVSAHPRLFHSVSEHLRRAPVQRFPYHFLYRETSGGIRVLVLRHDRRHPSVGLKRS